MVFGCKVSENFSVSTTACTVFIQYAKRFLDSLILHRQRKPCLNVQGGTVDLSPIQFRPHMAVISLGGTDTGNQNFVNSPPASLHSRHFVVTLQVMKLRYLYTALAAALAVTAQAQVTFAGSQHQVIEIEPNINTGLKKIFVLHDTDGVSMTYTATTENPVTFSIYGDMGGGYSQPIDEGITVDGLAYTLSQFEPNMGYIIDEGTTRYCFWVVDYSQYRMTLNGVTADNDGDCSTVTLHVDGEGREINFYTTIGAKRTLSRDIELSYDNLEWVDQEDTVQWRPTHVTELEENFKPTIVMPAPTCNTTFTLAGDRFMNTWGEGRQVESDLYTPAAVDVRAIATQDSELSDNEKSSGAEGSLGGSAPVHITFEAKVTDAVIHYEWQMATDPDFNDIQLRLNQEVVEQDFDEAGVTYWRFIGSNSDGSCSAISETFTVDIGVSELNCPNIFTPGNNDGNNDFWKVSYRSIVDFHCWIFNRWGNKICEFTDPSQGWDGTYHGKLVNPGVYYYVIQARGSDGKNYKKSGDINIIRKREHSSTSPLDPTAPDTPSDPDTPVE